MCLTPVSHRRPRKPQDTLLRSFGLLALRLLANSRAWRTHPLLPFQLLRSSPRGPRLRMRTDAPTGPAWEEGMEMRLGPAARARSLLFPPVAGRAPGGAAPRHPKAELQWPRPPREGPGAPPPGRGRPQVSPLLSTSPAPRLKRQCTRRQ
ncbi:unnamed protein product [Rangifer tarandus platyrhynchus]|uniref:Uncharacterized protein n=1 Tax=Rangifer tarandus platyrhynchus TaxID=3082113 RepID=A0AC59YU91_RANTA